MVVVGTLLAGILVASLTSFGGQGLATGKMLGCPAPATWFVESDQHNREGQREPERARVSQSEPDS